MPNIKNLRKVKKLHWQGFRSVSYKKILGILLLRVPPSAYNDTIRPRAPLLPQGLRYEKTNAHIEWRVSIVKMDPLS